MSRCGPPSRMCVSCCSMDDGGRIEDRIETRSLVPCWTVVTGDELNKSHRLQRACEPTKVSVCFRSEFLILSKTAAILDTEQLKQNRKKKKQQVLQLMRVYFFEDMNIKEPKIATTTSTEKSTTLFNKDTNKLPSIK